MMRAKTAMLRSAGTPVTLNLCVVASSKVTNCRANISRHLNL
jgi:hypothetical protein